MAEGKLGLLYVELGAKNALSPALKAAQLDFSNTVDKAKFLNAAMASGDFRKHAQAHAQLAVAQKKATGIEEWEKLVATQGKLQATLTLTQEKLKGVSQVSAGVFASGLGLIMGTSASVGGAAMDTFTGSLKLLSMEIGTVFQPYLLSASVLVQNLAYGFEDLDDSTKALIGRWVVMGTAGAGLLMVLPRIIGFANLGISAVKGLATAFGILNLSTGGILVALGAVAGVLAVIVSNTEDAGGGLGGLGEALRGFMEGLAPIGEAVSSIFQEIAPVFKSFLNSLAPLGPAFAALFNAIQPLLIAFVESLAHTGEILVPTLVGVVTVLTFVAETLKTVYNMIVRVINSLMDVLRDFEIFGNHVFKDVLPAPLKEISEDKKAKPVEKAAKKEIAVKAAFKDLVKPRRPFRRAMTKEAQPAFMAFDQARKSLQVAAAGMDPLKEEEMRLRRKADQNFDKMARDLERLREEFEKENGPKANQRDWGGGGDYGESGGGGSF